MTRRLICALSTAALMATAMLTGGAQAATVTLTFSGSVSNVSVSNVIDTTVVGLGDRVSGTIVLDDQAAGAAAASAGTDYAITSFAITLPGGRTDLFDQSAVLNVRNDCTTNCVVAGNPAVDGFTFAAGSGRDFVSSVLSSTDTSLLANEGLAGVIAFFDAGNTPASGFNLSVTTIPDAAGFDRYGNDCDFVGFCQFQANIDTLAVAAPMTPVPLPAGMALMVTALGGFAFLRRRRAA